MSIALLLCVCPLLLQTGCSDSEETFVEQPVETLYNQAMDYLENGSYSRAALAFVEVERQHPYSALAPKSLLMAAYSYYQAKKYDDAIENYNVFIQLHPGHEYIAYAYYMVGICYYEQVPMIERDQKTTEDALRAFEEVTRRYSASPYGKDARLKTDLIRDHLAGKEMDVGRYYLKQQAYLAALNRFKNVVEGFQSTSHTPEALHRIVECYLALGILDQAQKTAAILGYNYPGSTWYEDTYSLIRDTIPDALSQAPKPGTGPKGKEKPAESIEDSSPLTQSPVPIGKAPPQKKPKG
ncbi:MAG: outer membrane protein assembly factor BamD [Alphaproteobacteria bacterium]|nr:outer membrane protein assembly factor BamD [Alphaproteobacteria bacterium]